MYKQYVRNFKEVYPIYVGEYREIRMLRTELYYEVTVSKGSESQKSHTTAMSVNSRASMGEHWDEFI